MTIVEFYDEEIMDNVAGTLMLNPERTVFLGSDSECEKFVRRFRSVLEGRGSRTLLSFEKIDISTVETAYEKIIECIEKYPDCHFDISGGAETLLVAIGRASESVGVPIYKLDAVSQTVTSMTGESYGVENVSLTVEELIELHGGKIAPTQGAPETRQWQPDKVTEDETDSVWAICRSDCGAWNAALGTARGYRADRRSVMAAIWYKLKNAGLVRRTDTGVKYKSKYVEYLLQKQGTALEMYTYMCSKLALDRTGESFFADGRSGCSIRWQDAVENEVDVLLTRGIRGYFVSCKNGSVISDELYKLSIVAERFGGRYAKKILVLSHFEPDRSLTERAKELDIKLIKNVRAMSKKALAKKLADE